jgi:hypothetical protein
MYFANPCGSDAILESMVDGWIGFIDTPRQKNTAAANTIHAAGVTWCADNGAFSDRFDEDEWWRFLVANAHRADTCAFATAPDVVGDAWRSHFRSMPWLKKIRQLGYKVAYVAQDGLEHHPIPWHDFDCLFIGGSTEWKLGPHARELAREAKRRGKWLHMGRVNSGKRFAYARAIGCDSVDGTFLTFGPDTNLPRLLTWVRGNDQLDMFGDAS